MKQVSCYIIFWKILERVKEVYHRQNYKEVCIPRHSSHTTSLFDFSLNFQAKSLETTSQENEYRLWLTITASENDFTSWARVLWVREVIPRNRDCIGTPRSAATAFSSASPKTDTSDMTVGFIVEPMSWF